MIAKFKELKDARIVVATSTNPNDDLIEELVLSNGVECFRGDENNVLNRFICAAEHYNAERIIRVCSDNPFLELQSIERLLSVISDSKDVDYIGFKVDGKPSILTHYGFWVEYVSLSALKKVVRLTNEKLYQEHVTNFIYNNPSEFKIEWLETPKILEQYPSIRLTIDTQEDFDLASKLYCDVIIKYPRPTVEQVVREVAKNSEYIQRMKNQIELNSK